MVRFSLRLIFSTRASKVYLVFGFQVSLVSVIGLIMMLNEDIRDAIQDMNMVVFWVPTWILMGITMFCLHAFYEDSPQNIFAQFAYLFTWGSALAVVACDFYPGAGVLMLPGVICLGGGFLGLSLLARRTLNWTYHAIVLVVCTSIPFQIVANNNEDQIEGGEMPHPAVTFICCNIFMALVEIYLIWKMSKSMEAHGTNQIWISTADLLLASFGVPLIFPCQVIVLKLGMNCCGSRYLEGRKGKDDA